jgi:hypothetical protein
MTTRLYALFLCALSRVNQVFIFLRSKFTLLYLCTYCTFSANNSAENPSICRKLKFCKSSGSGTNMGRLKFLRWCLFKGTVSRDLLLHVFFHESSPEPLKITLGSFQIFSKTRGDISNQGAPPVSTTPVANNGNKIRFLKP